MSQATDNSGQRNLPSQFCPDPKCVHDLFFSNFEFVPRFFVSEWEN